MLSCQGSTVRLLCSYLLYFRFYPYVFIGLQFLLRVLRPSPRAIRSFNPVLPLAIVIVFCF